MRKIFSFVAAVAAMSLVLSCEREKSFDNQGSRELGVKVNEGAPQDVTTKAASESSPYTFEVNGEELSLTESVSKMRIQTRSIETKGNPITEAGDYFDEFSLNFYNASGEAYHKPVTVSYESGNWSLAESVFWPEDSEEDISFFASNSKGDSQSVTNTFSKEGVTHIVYSDEGSDSADPDDCNAAEGETDLLYAYTKTHMSAGDVEERENDRAISLTFHHALAGIKFQFGNMTDGMTLTDVTLSGIKTSGECDFTNNNGTAEFAWTTGDDAKTLRQTFGSKYSSETSTGTDCDATGEKTFFIIPQEISDDATITLTFGYELEAVSGTPAEDYAGTGKTFTKTVEVKFKDVVDGASVWESGMLYTYNITGNLVFAELGYTIAKICTTKVSPRIRKLSAVESVNFQVNQTEIPEGSVEVQSSRSITPVYAKFDSETGELSLYTTAPKIFANPNSAKLFSDLESLTKIDNLDKLDTRNVVTMQAMFYNCTALTSLDLRSFDTSNVTVMKSMFSCCTALTSLDVTNFDTSNVTDMAVMFYKCTALTSLDVTDFDTSNVTTMKQMFGSCTALTSLDVTKFDTSNVTDMGLMFYCCTALTSLDVTKFDTSNVTDMWSMFERCKSLTSLDVTNFNTSAVTTMLEMFYGCSGLTSLDVTNFDTSNVINMAGMFDACSSLTSLDVTKFNTSNVTNMDRMFEGCRTLTSLDVTKLNTSKVTQMVEMFYNCTNLTSLDVTNFDTSNVTSMQGMFENCTALASLDVTKFNTSNVTRMDWMFYGCQSLKSLDVTNFNTAKVTNMKYMFHYCMSLTTLDLSGFSTSNVTDMRGMFQFCYGLTSLSIDKEKFNTANVITMESMFAYCHLASLDVSGFDTSNVTDMKEMFLGCEVLTSLDLSSFNTSKVTTMASMLKECYAIKTLTLGSSFNLATTTTYMFKDFAKNSTSKNKAKINCSSDLATAITNGASTNSIDASKVEFVAI